MQRYRGLVARVSGIGARGDVALCASSRRHLLDQPRCTTKAHDCVKAVVISAAVACHGLVAAEVLDRVLERESLILHNFRALREVFHKAHESVTGWRVVRDEEVQRAMKFGKGQQPFVYWQVGEQEFSSCRSRKKSGCITPSWWIHRTDSLSNQRSKRHLGFRLKIFPDVEVTML